MLLFITNFATRIAVHLYHIIITASTVDDLFCRVNTDRTTIGGTRSRTAIAVADRCLCILCNSFG
jgi:hypothetical protein